MKNTESLQKLVKAMDDFSTAYNALKSQIEEYEYETHTSVNDLLGFTESYPFDKSFDELAIDDWALAVTEEAERRSFVILNYEYLNTGGNTMVGIHEVWLPATKQTVYAYTNEEGCNISLVDYIRNEFEVDDYDEYIVDYIDWGRVSGYEQYFELYRHCLNEYTKDDCKYFGITRGLPYFLLSDELQQQVTTEYRQWLDTEGLDHIETDGKKIIVNPDYESDTDVWSKMLTATKEFKRWHDTTMGVEDLYSENYKLTFAGHEIELPYTADVWNAIDDALKSVIENW